MAGEYPERSIESALSRVQQRVYYEQIKPDILQIAATYAVVISRAHSFADGNKRTAMVSMLMFLDAHGYRINVDAPEVGGQEMALWMEQCAAGSITDDELYALIFERLEKSETDSAETDGS